MRLSSLCATGYACSGVNRDDAGQQDVTAAFYNANVPQDLSINFDPQGMLDVAYPQASGGIGTFPAGDLVPRSATQQTPLFAVRGITDPGPFVIAIVDPDAPTPQNPTVSQIRHYLAGNFVQQPFSTGDGMFYTNGMNDDERTANSGGMGRNGGVGNNGGMGRNNGVDNNGGMGRSSGAGSDGGMSNGGVGRNGGFENNGGMNNGGMNNGGMGGNGGTNNNNGMGEQQLVSQTAPITDYLQPSPPSGSDAHRYVFLLFRQPDNFGDQQIVTPATSRLSFNISAFAEAVGLGDPLAGTFMLVAPDS